MSLVLRLLCTMLPMAIMQVYLNATGPVGFFYGFLGAACFIPLIHLRYRRLAGVLFFGAGAFIGLTLIVIQPLAGFLIWFDLVESGTMRGPVSAVFLYLGGYLSLAASYEAKPGRHLKSIVQVLLVNTLLAFIIFRLGWIQVLAGMLLPLLVIASLAAKPVPLFRRRGVANLAGLSVLAVLITLATAPGRVPAGIFLIDEYLSGFLRGAVFRFLPDFPVLYGFSGYGHGFSEERLGGKPLLSERALFALEGRAGSVYYLRTKAYDSFTGRGWSLSPGHPDSQASGRLPAAKAGEGQDLLRLTLLMDYYPLVPQILGAVTELPGRSGDGLVYRGSPATGLTLGGPLIYGDRLQVSLSTGFVHIQDTVPTLDPADDPLLYLSMPQTVAPAAREMAESLKGLSEVHLVRALADLLDEGFSYSLDPPEETDLLQHFLAESRTGYCVHFASAAVLLARLVGIPARYVTGFLVSLPKPEDDFLQVGSGGLVRSEITGLNSHAWAELWFPATGWITFEATPPMRQETSGETGFQAASADDFTLRQLAAITGGRVDLRRLGDGRYSKPISPARMAIILLAILSMALAGLGLYRRASSSGWYPGQQAFWWLLMHTGWWGGTASLASFSLRARRVVHLSSAWGIPGPERSGWLAWEEGVAALLSRHGINLDNHALNCQGLPLGFFREVFFGCRPPEDKDFLHLDQLARQLRSLSKRRAARSPTD
jgi:transglutaminase-like putative cysteine protease